MSSATCILLSGSPVPLGTVRVTLGALLGRPKDCLGKAAVTEAGEQGCLRSRACGL